MVRLLLKGQLGSIHGVWGPQVNRSRTIKSTRDPPSKGRQDLELQEQ